MYYQIRERLFSMNDVYDITDETGVAYYQVRQRLLSIGDKLDLFDTVGEPVASIEQRLLSFIPEFDIFEGGQLAAEVKKLFSLLSPKYEIDGPEGLYEMEGDWLSRNYSISLGGRTLARVSRQWAAFANTYAMEVEPGVNVPLMLSIAIVMEEINQSH